MFGPQGRENWIDNCDRTKISLVYPCFHPLMSLHSLGKDAMLMLNSALTYVATKLDKITHSKCPI